MKKTMLVLAAVGVLALSACSSDEGSDTSPGGNGASATPQASDTVTPQPTDQGGDPGSSDICNLMASSTSPSLELNDAMDVLSGLLDDEENWDSPATLTALHTQGQVMVDKSAEVASILNQAAAEISDPEVSAAFAKMANYFETLVMGMGQAAVEANSMMDYLLGMSSFLDEDTMNQMMDDLESSAPVISDYIYDTCGYMDIDF